MTRISDIVIILYFYKVCVKLYSLNFLVFIIHILCFRDVRVFVVPSAVVDNFFRLFDYYHVVYKVYLEINRG